MTDQEKNGEAMSEWRPEGWVQPYGIGDETPPMAYETGADAILAALRAEVPDGSFGHRNEADDNGFYDAIISVQTVPGRLVFIPDEKEATAEAIRAKTYNG
ncbi:hypothetical protein LCGC14_3061600 [marine sediment metagenome]|uniref:Uncharacterized protein n=1 Tax=marine sediment metagenome TaxID=412755 RepID=A0A0F8WJ96_9ZZZZ